MPINYSTYEDTVVNTTDMMNITTEIMTTEDFSNVSAPGPQLPRGFLICNQPNTFLWSVILAFATFAIALFLRKLRKGKFLGKQVKIKVVEILPVAVLSSLSLSLSFQQGRRLVSDFGVLMAIAVMVMVAYFVKPYIAIEVIIVAPNYSVTNSTARDWFINPFDGSLSIVAGFAAFIPAALVSLDLTDAKNCSLARNLRRFCCKFFFVSRIMTSYLCEICLLVILPWCALI